MARPDARFKPQFLTVAQAAEPLHLSTGTIDEWIAQDAIPYIELPADRPIEERYRIPVRGLIASLPENLDLPGAIRELVAAAQAAGVDADASFAGGGQPELVEHFRKHRDANRQVLRMLGHPDSPTSQDSGHSTKPSTPTRPESLDR